MAFIAPFFSFVFSISSILAIENTLNLSLVNVLVEIVCLLIQSGEIRHDVLPTGAFVVPFCIVDECYFNQPDLSHCFCMFLHYFSWLLVQTWVCSLYSSHLSFVQAPCSLMHMCWFRCRLQRILVVNESPVCWRWVTHTQGDSTSLSQSKHVWWPP